MRLRVASIATASISISASEGTMSLNPKQHMWVWIRYHNA
jgi:hypothetical protein